MQNASVKPNKYLLTCRSVTSHPAGPPAALYGQVCCSALRAGAFA